MDESQGSRVGFVHLPAPVPSINLRCTYFTSEHLILAMALPLSRSMNSSAIIDSVLASDTYCRGELLYLDGTRKILFYII